MLYPGLHIIFQARTNESLKVPQLDIAVPVNIKGSKVKKFGRLQYTRLEIRWGFEDNFKIFFSKNICLDPSVELFCDSSYDK